MDYETCLKETNLEADLPHIGEYVDDYGYYGSVPMRKYLEHWYEGKSVDLLGIFKNRLIIEEPVTYQEPDCAVEDRLADRILDSSEWWERVLEPFDIITSYVLLDGHSWNEFGWCISDERREWQHQHEIEHRFYLHLRAPLRYKSYLCDNAMNDADSITPSEYNNMVKPFSFEENSKPFRVIRRFAQSVKPLCLEKWPHVFDEDFFNDFFEALEHFRIIHSQCLNQKVLKGTLCLSIHPLDYMTMSDNGYGWTSCMRWDGPGEYRAGTVEMMNSPLVVVAYLKGDEPWHPTQSSWTWSNKKWRELFIVHRNVVSGIKGYPYYCEQLETLALGKLTEMCKEYGWPEYQGILDSRDAGRYFDDGKRYLEFLTHIMYNDTNGNCVRYCISSNIDEDKWEVCGDRATVNYSGIAYCFKCNDPLDFDSSYDNCSSLLCSDCDGRHLCANCGCIVNEDYGSYINGEWYCEDCVDYCDICDQPFVSDENEGGYIGFIFKVQDKWVEHGVCTCPCCMAAYGSETTFIDGADYPDQLGRWYGGLRVALPTIDDAVRAALNCKYGVISDELVDFSIKQPA